MKRFLYDGGCKWFGLILAVSVLCFPVGAKADPVDAMTLGLLNGTDGKASPWWVAQAEGMGEGSQASGAEYEAWKEKKKSANNKLWDGVLLLGSGAIAIGVTAGFSSDLDQEWEILGYAIGAGAILVGGALVTWGYFDQQDVEEEGTEKGFVGLNYNPTRKFFGICYARRF